MTRSLLTLAVVFAAIALPADGAAQDLEWRDEFRSVAWQEMAVIAASTATISVIHLGLDEPREARWIGPVLADDISRGFFLATDEKGIAAASALSDLFLTTLLGYTIVIDSIGITGLANDEWNSAFQSSTIAVQSHMLNIAVTSTLKHALGRRRPGFGLCYEAPFSSEECAERPNVSFPSGHTSSAFTGAGLICVTHEFLGYYGEVGDKIACFTGIAMATATGILRITSNNHYLSDIMIGGAIGFGFGYVLPRFLYFGGAEAADDVETSAAALRQPVPPPAVISFGGTF